jgi:hypothetical protein
MLLLTETGICQATVNALLAILWMGGSNSRIVRTLIKHEGVSIFSEPARYEGYRRFEDIAQILKAKYGDRIKGLVPTEGIKLYLSATMGKLRFRG